MKEQRFGDKMDLRGSRTVNWITKWFCGCGESCIKAVTSILKVVKLILQIDIQLHIRLSTFLEDSEAIVRDMAPMVLRII